MKHVPKHMAGQVKTAVLTLVVNYILPKVAFETGQFPIYNQDDCVEANQKLSVLLAFPSNLCINTGHDKDCKNISEFSLGLKTFQSLDAT